MYVDWYWLFQIIAGICGIMGMFFSFVGMTRTVKVRGGYYNLKEILKLISKRKISRVGIVIVIISIAVFIGLVIARSKPIYGRFVKIISPSDGGTVQLKTIVVGNVDRQHYQGWMVWVYICRDDDYVWNRFGPELVEANGIWSVRCRFKGEPDDNFQIFAFLTDFLKRFPSKKISHKELVLKKGIKYEGVWLISAVKLEQ